jgi:hypothetical protein
MAQWPIALYQAIEKDVGSYMLGIKPNMELPPDADHMTYSAVALLKSIFKKWNESSDTADAAAYAKFSACNNSCANWSLNLEWESDRLLYGEFLKEVDNFLHPSGALLVESFDQILDHARCGPGASLGSNHQSFYAKMYDSKMATTSMDLYVMYRDHVSRYPTMCEAECQRRIAWGYPNLVDCSKLSFVPKTTDISRIICSEPSLNMYFQLGLGALLEGRMRSRFGIDLATQPDKNRLLARIGSETGGFATIDLSSASDCISLNLCKQIFPAWFLETLMSLRSPYCRIGTDRVKLEMMSTMGNGFTFPLQTVIFSCLIRAAYNVEGIPLQSSCGNEWGCFGDDIICRTECVRHVLRLLQLLGFVTNGSKTFFEGPFRESCGTDWFNGHPVRGVYLKRLDTPQDYCIAVNLLNTWTAYTGIPLINGISWLTKRFRGNYPFVPFDESNDSGIRVPFAVLERKNYRRDRNGTMVYRAYRSQPIFYTFNDDGSIIYPRKAKRNLGYNPSGLLLSFLRGEVVRCKISCRNDRVSYRPKLVCTPFWDYKPSSSTDVYRMTWQQWETAVLINISNSL